MTNNTIL